MFLTTAKQQQQHIISKTRNTHLTFEVDTEREKPGSQCIISNTTHCCANGIYTFRNLSPLLRVYPACNMFLLFTDTMTMGPCCLSGAQLSLRPECAFD